MIMFKKVGFALMQQILRNIQTSSQSIPNTDIRAATPGDIPRAAYVAAAGYYYSPVNAYERPKRDRYPQDTVANYGQKLLDFLWESDCALFVVEAGFDNYENAKVYRALSKEFEGHGWSRPSGKVIVGLVALKFKLASSRIGQYQPKGERTVFHDDDDLKRDQSPEGLEILSKALQEPFRKHLAGKFEVSMLVVHPAYWRRGYGTSLLNFAAMLADEDGVQLGIASVEMGVKNAREAGFEQREIVRVDGYSQHQDDFVVWIGVREPSKSFP